MQEVKDSPKKYFLFDRRAAFEAAAWATLLFAAPFVAFVPYSQSVNLHTLEMNLNWIGFFVLLALDAMKQNFGRSLAYGTIIAIFYSVFPVCMTLGPVLADYSQRRQFDSKTWKSAAQKSSAGQQSDIRLHMVDDLLQQQKLVGMSRAQVVDLLGHPDTEDVQQGNSEYIYYLGPERGFVSIDDEWLDIKFSGELVVSAIDCTD